MEKGSDAVLAVAASPSGRLLVLTDDRKRLLLLSSQPFYTPPSPPTPPAPGMTQSNITSRIKSVSIKAGVSGRAISPLVRLWFPPLLHFRSPSHLLPEEVVFFFFLFVFRPCDAILPLFTGPHLLTLFLLLSLSLSFYPSLSPSIPLSLFLSLSLSHLDNYPCGQYS